MNRVRYYNYIEQKLFAHAAVIENRGKLNILDYHQHSESFYLFLFNKLFGWNLVNLNATQHNVEAIDLIDRSNKIAVQVSSTATKVKIESALGKDLSHYVGYNFKFISISKDAAFLRSHSFKNPHALNFAPQTDIYDIQLVLRDIYQLSIEKLIEIYNFIKDELGSDNDSVKIESNLASVINILAQEDWRQQGVTFQTKPFEVEAKINFNKLNAARRIIDDYNIHHGRVDKIYSEFDSQGANKSNSVLSSIQREYLENSANLGDDALFFKVIDRVLDRIENSSNYVKIPFEELELCVNILVVDAFIRCKVFKNPQGN